MDQYIGKMLDGRYEILERIGTGGMAVVYKAKCHRLNRLVAVKILKSDLAQDEDFRRRFNAESQAVAQLSHPNIVSVYDVSRGGDTEYIVMELIDGITLKQYMEKRGELNWRESLHFITQIMRGLSHAHSRGIIHRDIKPQNIMVLRDGSVKVADFGIACLENSAQTLTQEALGSVHYISPEQARGDRTDARSDIYSSGVVLYEMLSGRLPFEGDSAVSVAIQHLSSIPLAPREVKPDIPEQLELICMKAMAPDLERRYPSAEAMIADLESFRKNPGVNLDYTMEDLRPEEVDEPTRLLRTGGHTAVSAPAREREAARRSREYDDYPPERPVDKKRTAIVVAVSIAAVLVMFLLFRSIFQSFNPVVAEYTVPTVLGCTEVEANEQEGVKGVFEIVVAGTEPSDYKVGTIARQDPEGGRVTKTDLVIRVWISAGTGTGEMPNVVKEDIRIANQMLKDLVKDLDLTVETTKAFSDEYTLDTVMDSNPAAGETLEKGDTIQLTVSQGPKIGKVTVPSFVGQPLEKVKGDLEKWKLTLGPVKLIPSDQSGGVIVSQTIPDTTEVDENTTIGFEVSSGLAPTVRNINCELPDDRDTVQLSISVGNEVQFDEKVDCSKTVMRVPLTGSGTQTVVIFWDGMEQVRYELQFD
ncbi:MAG: Stk1 family PASTA domain-containing Ser/Thr kinase [Oscillibacter sp.]